MKVLRIVAVITLAATSLLAQPREGRTKELSLSGGYQNYSSEGGSGSSGVFLLSPRLGFYVVEGLELEPEALVLLSSGSDPTYALNGLVSYNFVQEGQAVPFLLVGYGMANTVPFFNVPFSRIDFSVGVLNAGGGVKVFLKEDVAIRVEYRFQKFFGEGETHVFGPYIVREKVDTRIHSFQFGFSILL